MCENGQLDTELYLISRILFPQNHITGLALSNEVRYTDQQDTALEIRYVPNESMI
jgi:hypothetical protein